MSSLKEFEQEYMNGGGRRYDGSDSIDHSLFRQFLKWLKGNLKELVKESIDGDAVGGVKNQHSILLRSNVPQKYSLPKGVCLYGLELLGVGEIEIGTTEGNIGEMGDFSGEAGDTISFGFWNTDCVWLRSNTDVEITIITYNKI